MVFFDMTVTCDNLTVSIPVEGESYRDHYKLMINRSKQLQSAVELAIEKRTENGKLIYVTPYEESENTVCLAVGICLEKLGLEEGKNAILNGIRSIWKTDSAELTSCKEVSAEMLMSLYTTAESNEMIRSCQRAMEKVGFTYFEHHCCKVHEEILKGGISYEDAKTKADSMMSNSNFYEELERIYSSENMQEYYGNPVHYVIRTGNREACRSMVNLLGEALLENHRLLGTRVTYINNITRGCFDDPDLENIFRVGQGNIVVVELGGENENVPMYIGRAYEEVIRYFTSMVEKYHHNTLFVFFINEKSPSSLVDIAKEVKQHVRLIEISEGCGTREQAKKYLLEKGKEARFPMAESDVEELLASEESLSFSEANAIYSDWERNCLSDRIYKAYKVADGLYAKEEEPTDTAYAELKSMIGLTQVKQVVDDIIDAGKIRELRGQMGLNEDKSSLHMIFTGTPGTAKTTVARLLARILNNEGVISTDHVVECGRADLVGKYVGWTAKAVKEKFKQARGGILFIDEAYSLVDRDKSFGDEAINTIVQEMENHREDVIVIFAGYPDKMKEFLDKNEGLRSRIAFHVNFPNYNQQELLEILNLMVKNKGFKALDQKTQDKCLTIFEAACTNEQFGNGRFVRNLLEQAIMKQSARVVRANRGKRITKAKLLSLIAEDFEVNAGEQYKTVKKVIGF